MNDILAKLFEVAGKVDTKVWFIIGAVLAVLIVVWLAKKALKVGIIVAIIVLVVTYVPGIMSSQLDKHGIELSKEGISISNEDTNFELDFDSIVAITLVDRTSNSVTLQVQSDVGTKKVELSIEVYTVVKMVANGMGIKIIGDI